MKFQSCPLRSTCAQSTEKLCSAQKTHVHTTRPQNTQRQPQRHRHRRKRIYMCCLRNQGACACMVWIIQTTPFPPYFSLSHTHSLSLPPSQIPAPPSIVTHLKKHACAVHAHSGAKMRDGGGVMRIGGGVMRIDPIHPPTHPPIYIYIMALTAAG